MKTATCKCGNTRAWGEMPPCSACDKCGTAPGYSNQPAESHRFSKKFDQNNGKPFLFCMVCGKKEVSAESGTADVAAERPDAGDR